MREPPLVWSRMRSRTWWRSGRLERRYGRGSNLNGAWTETRPPNKWICLKLQKWLNNLQSKFLLISSGAINKLHDTIRGICRPLPPSIISFVLTYYLMGFYVITDKTNSMILLSWLGFGIKDPEILQTVSRFKFRFRNIYLDSNYQTRCTL